MSLRSPSTFGVLRCISTGSPAECHMARWLLLCHVNVCRPRSKNANTKMKQSPKNHGGAAYRILCTPHLPDISVGGGRGDLVFLFFLLGHRSLPTLLPSFSLGCRAEEA